MKDLFGIETKGSFQHFSPRLLQLPCSEGLVCEYERLIAQDTYSLRDVVELFYITEVARQLVQMLKDPESLTSIDFKKDKGETFHSFAKGYLKKNLSGDSFQSLHDYDEKTWFWLLFVEQKFWKDSSMDMQSFIHSLPKDDIEQICIDHREIITGNLEVFRDILTSDVCYFHTLYSLKYPTGGAKPALFSIKDDIFRELLISYIQLEDANPALLQRILINKPFIRRMNLSADTIATMEERVDAFFKSIHSTTHHCRMAVKGDPNLPCAFRFQDPVHTEHNDLLLTFEINTELFETAMKQIPFAVLSNILLLEGGVFILGKTNFGWGKLERLLTFVQYDFFQQSISMNVMQTFLANILSKITDGMEMEGRTSFLKLITNFIDGYILKEIAEEGVGLNLGQNVQNIDWVSRCKLLYADINTLPKIYSLYSTTGKKVSIKEYRRALEANYSEILSLEEGIAHAYINRDNKDCNSVMNALFVDFAFYEEFSDASNCYEWLVKYSPDNDIPSNLLPVIQIIVDKGLGKIKDSRFCFDVDDKSSNMVIEILAFIKKCGELPIIASSSTSEEHIATCLLVGANWLTIDFNPTTRKGKLFSTDEANYIDHILNDKKYSNSLALRNKYCHGGGSITCEAEAFEDYGHGLTVLILMAIRMYEDINASRIAKEALDEASQQTEAPSNTETVIHTDSADS